MRNITLEELLESGAHFGHQVTRQNPKAREYIFEARDNIHIIDLAKTKEGLDEAAAYAKSLAEKGGTMIILGAKRQAEPVVRAQAKRVQDANVDGLYFVTNRWIGGILTNFHEVNKNFKKLKELTKFMSTPSEKARFTKKEISLMEKERAKLESFYWGVQDMPKIPDALFVIDTHLEELAVKEAIAMGVTTVGMTDTNADPTIIDYPIPANDDALGSVDLIVSHIVDSWIEGRTGKAPVSEKADEKDSVKADKTQDAVVDATLDIDEKQRNEVELQKEVNPEGPSIAVTEKKAPKAKKAPAKKSV